MQSINHHLDRITEAADIFEHDSLGAHETTWLTANKEIEHTVKEQYQVPQHVRIEICTVTNAVRIIGINEGRSEIRYMTPYNVWGLIETPEIWIMRDPNPIDVDVKTIIIKHLPRVLPRTHMLESKFQIKMLLDMQYNAQLKVGKTITQKGERINQYTLYGNSQNIICPACNKGNHQIKWSINHISKSFNSHCENTKNKSLILPVDTANHFFGRTISKAPRKKKIQLSVLPHNTYNEFDNPANDNTVINNFNYVEPHEEKEENDISDTYTPKLKRKHGLHVMTWNTDNRANDYLFKIVDHANSEDVDVVCLQEAGGINWSNNAVQHLGFNLYAHGQVMILVRQSTAETIHMPQLVWRSEGNNAMSITLLTATGPLAIINGYLPSGLDSITKDINQPKYWKALDTHMEINERISQHTHSIINMDANETNNKYDRIQIHKSDIGKPIPSGSDGLNTTVSLYTKNMKDAHRMTNDHLYTSHPPSQQTYTHQQPNVGMITKSKIDISLVSNNIAHRLQSCNIYDTPKYWTKSKTLHPLQQHRNNYHSIIITKLKWDNIWAPTNCNTQNNPNPNLKGEKLKPGPNTNNLNATTKIDLAQAVNIALKQK